MIPKEKFIEHALRIGNLVFEKNQAYGSSFSTSEDMLKLLFPNGVKPDQYGDMLLLARIWDKMMRIATAKDAFGENPFQDIMGYGLLGTIKDEEEKDGAPR